MRQNQGRWTECAKLSILGQSAVPPVVGPSLSQLLPALQDVLKEALLLEGEMISGYDHFLLQVRPSLVDNS